MKRYILIFILVLVSITLSNKIEEIKPAEQEQMVNLYCPYCCVQMRDLNGVFVCSETEPGLEHLLRLIDRGIVEVVND